MEGTSAMKSSFYEIDVSGKSTINNSNNAYSLRHKVHDHGIIGTQSTNYVTDT